MGAAYARVALGRTHPAVGLLSIGEEPGKGTDLVREAHAGLAKAPLNFIGNLDARELFSGRADVIVCDGFTGNVALKVGEGLVDMLAELFGRDPASREAFDRLRHRIDYAEHGAAPLLGLAGLALVGHGRSSARAIHSAVALAARLVSEHLVEKLSDALGAA
jgi:glycerol-3-phosphate acyltransferase PlsX